MHRLRVLTLNLWNKQGDWSQRLPLIRRAIASLAPDFVGLQEVLRLDADAPDSVLNSQALEVADGLGYQAVFGSALGVGGGLHFGNALLSRFSLEGPTVWTLPGLPEEQNRCLVHAVAETPRGALPLFVTHLDWQFDRGALRQEQVRFIDERIRERQRPGDLPALLLGDLNAEPDSDEIRWLSGLTALGGRSVYYADAWRVAGDGTPGHTFCKRNPHAEPLGEPDRRLDYIFVRAPEAGRGQVLTCRVVCDEPVEGLFASDHFGVYAELAW